MLKEFLSAATATASRVSVDVTELTQEKAMQIRFMENAGHMAELAEAIASYKEADKDPQAEIPPPLCLRYRDVIYIVDGKHRVGAYIRAGFSEIDVRLIENVPEDVVAEAGGVKGLVQLLNLRQNAKTQLPLTNAEKRAVVRNFVTATWKDDKDGIGVSVRAAADILGNGCTYGLVQKIIQEVREEKAAQRGMSLANRLTGTRSVPDVGEDSPADEAETPIIATPATHLPPAPRSANTTANVVAARPPAPRSASVQVEKLPKAPAILAAPPENESDEEAYLNEILGTALPAVLTVNTTPPPAVPVVEVVPQPDTYFIEVLVHRTPADGSEPKTYRFSIADGQIVEYEGSSPDMHSVGRVVKDEIGFAFGADFVNA